MSDQTNQATPKSTNGQQPAAERRSTLGVIVHSFFIVPFLIAVLGVLLYTGVRILTIEPDTVYDYLADIRTAGATRRWQAAFELSKVLASPDQIPTDPRFVAEMNAAFSQGERDDQRVRQYVALAMGQSDNPAFVATLLSALDEEQEESNLYAFIFALGMFSPADSPQLTQALIPYASHESARARLAAVMALGNRNDQAVLPVLEQRLLDEEPNVRWDAAISLAKLGDPRAKPVLLQLLDREYLVGFANVDAQEQNGIMAVAIRVAADLHDPELNEQIRQLGENDGNLNVRRTAQEVLR